jgi:PKHD-type hydroxylase
MQYTVYYGDREGHYDAHIDSSANTQCPRKLSIVLQLTDPAEYEGGELQIINDSRSPLAVQKARGLVAAFPSFALHKVTPVTKGIRKTIVIWITGPAFR